MMRGFLLWCLVAVLPCHGESIRIVGAWEHRRGDITPDSLRRIVSTKSLFISHNTTLSLQFDGAKGPCFYRIRPSETYSAWIELGPGCTLQLPQLPGGNYTLELRSLQQGSAGLRLELSVEQPFWRLWWFWVAVILYVALLVGIGLYFFSLYNIRQKLKLHDIRNQIAADLHDEVGSNLNSIAIFAELLRQKSTPEQLPILDRITNNSVESVQLMQDTVWALQVHNDDPSRLLEKMRSFASEILTAKGIELMFENRFEAQPSHRLTMAQRKNAYLVFKEVVNNAVKHSGASRVRCRVWSDEGLLHIELNDNGQGFDTNQVSEGNGIKNYALRCQEESIWVRLDSSPQQGTTVCISLLIG